MKDGDDGAVRAAVTALVTALVSEAGFDLEDLAVRLAAGRRLIRVVVDRDGGVDLDAAAALSRSLSLALDDEFDAAVGEAPYALEVTSRGIGAPLTLPRHFRRAAGRLVTLVRVGGDALTGRIGRVDGGRLVILTGPDGLTEQVIDMADIASAAVEVEFAPVTAAVRSALERLQEPHEAGAPGTQGGDAA